MKIYSHETHTQRSKQEVLKEEATTPSEPSEHEVLITIKCNPLYLLYVSVTVFTKCIPKPHICKGTDANPKGIRTSENKTKGMITKPIIGPDKKLAKVVYNATRLK